jgi:hypothetical protein
MSAIGLPGLPGAFPESGPGPRVPAPDRSLGRKSAVASGIRTLFVRGSAPGDRHTVFIIGSEWSAGHGERCAIQRRRARSAWQPGVMCQRLHLAAGSESERHV